MTPSLLALSAALAAGPGPLGPTPQPENVGVTVTLPDDTPDNSSMFRGYDDFHFTFGTGPDYAGSLGLELRLRKHRSSLGLAGGTKFIRVAGQEVNPFTVSTTFGVVPFALYAGPRYVVWPMINGGVSPNPTSELTDSECTRDCRYRIRYGADLQLLFEWLVFSSDGQNSKVIVRAGVGGHLDPYRWQVTPTFTLGFPVTLWAPVE